jgi:hypothetical protein
MMQFKGFKPDALQRIAGTLGYQGDMNGFNDYLSQNPDKMNTMNMYQQKAMQMARGGMAIRSYEQGGFVPAEFFDMSTGSLSKGNTYGVTAGGERLISKVGPDGNKYFETIGGDTGNIITNTFTDQNEAFKYAGISGPQDPKILPTTTPTTTTSADQNTTISDISAARVTNPVLPTGGMIQPVGTVLTQEQLIPTTSGQVSGDIVAPVATADTAAAAAPTTTTVATVDPRTVTQEVKAVTDEMQAAQGTVAEEAVVDAAQQAGSAVSELTAAQGNAILMDNPVQREIQEGELISGVADATKAAKFTEEVQAAEATPTEKATVQGQLDGLMQQFEGGATPAWAAGAMRAATAQMSARGLGASSMAGQAIIQAAMESALPVAMADAQTIASFESQNLTNRQQRAMLAAQQRATFMGQEFDQAFQSRVMNASKISDVANMNFTAEQQVALENSRIANTMSLANLNNEQAVVLAEAAALSQLDMANLNNRQQAAVMNAQNIMQMDMTNLSNRQQTETIKSQQRVQALFTDQAAENAAKQFNATSQNQTDQFFANLATQTSQFNAAQTNAQNQYNAGEINTSSRFTSEMMNQREQFNAQNKLVIDQNNAVWRREIATADTAAINRSNELNAAAMLDISESAYNNLWQYYADTMEYAYTAANNERDRMTQLAVAKMQVDASFDVAKWNADSNSTAAIGNAIVKIATSNAGDTILDKAWDWFTGS